MFISTKILLRFKKKDVMRLVSYLGITSHNRKYEDILEELHIRINWV